MVCCTVRAKCELDSLYAKVIRGQELHLKGSGGEPRGSRPLPDL